MPCITDAVLILKLSHYLNIMERVSTDKITIYYCSASMAIDLNCLDNR